MGPKTATLCNRLDETISLLESVGESHWTGWLRKAVSQIRDSDFAGIEHLGRAFGGMGSFNELVLSGHGESARNESQVNARLYALRTELYDLVQQIKQEAEIV
jgi:hypothetical protein